MALSEWNIELKSAKLPEKPQAAFKAVTESLVGAKYEPVLYIGHQPVNGINYCIMAIEKPITLKPRPRLVIMQIHESLEGKFKLLSIRGLLL